jgi:putative chitinase
MTNGPGALNATRQGINAVDGGTSARTRTPAPAHRHAPPRHAAPPGPVQPLSPQELQVLTAIDAAGIVDATERAMLLAQVAHESGGFRHTQENLHYSADRLLSVFPSHFSDLADAKPVAAGGTDEIAERIYGGRADLGNTTAGDGARFIGRGLIQVTGRANYTAAGAALGLDLVNHPELAQERTNAARIAVWFWNVHGLGPAARRGDVAAVTRVINGGRVGLADRQRRFRRYHILLHHAPPAIGPVLSPLAAMPQAGP